MREIHITPVLNGFIVKVGCTTLVFDSIDLLCSELKRYQEQPDIMEERYLRHPLNSNKNEPQAERAMDATRPTQAGQTLRRE
jgi:hypothetical protein